MMSNLMRENSHSCRLIALEEIPEETGIVDDGRGVAKNGGGGIGHAANKYLDRRHEADRCGNDPYLLYG
jgi:hypothetical protein